MGRQACAHGDEAVWIEAHPASSSHVEDMANKARWLRGGRPRLQAITAPRPFAWVASGRVVLQRGSPQAHRLAMGGLAFRVRELTL